MITTARELSLDFRLAQGVIDNSTSGPIERFRDEHGIALLTIEHYHTGVRIDFEYSIDSQGTCIYIQTNSDGFQAYLNGKEWMGVGPWRKVASMPEY